MIARPALAFAVLLCLSGFAGAQTHPEPRTISVTGEGKVSARPDRAVLSLGVVTEAPSAAEALSRTSERANAVIAAIKAAGIAEKDIRTSGLRVEPRMAYQTGRAPRIEGYTARNEVRINVSPPERVGGLIDTLVAAGANEISGLFFEVSDRTEKLDEARREAVADARRKAELYASALGVPLGDVRAVSETDAFMPPPRPMLRMGAAAAEVSTPVEPGEEEIRASVAVVFEIGP